MVKKFTVLLLLFVSILSFAKNEPEGISLTKTSDGYIVNFTLPDYQQKIISVNGIEYVQLDMPQYGTTSEPGLPALPLSSFNLAVPYKTDNLSIEVLNRTDEVIYLKEQVYPFQEPWEKNLLLSDRPFTINNNYYKTEGTKFPFASLSDEFVLGGVKGNIILIHPFIYNPAEGKLTVIKSGSFKIKISGSGTLVANRSAFYDAFLDEVFVNYEGKSVNKGMNYLIITAPEFEAGLAPFVTHKSSMGFTVDLFNTTAAGTTTTAIKTFIQQRYINPNTKPDFVLLVGDIDKIPAWTGTGTGTPKTDLNYACVEGTDPYADLFIGRFSVTNATQLQNAINKIVYMGNNLATFPKKNVFMASTDNYLISEGTHNYVISTYFDPNNYTNLKLFSHSGATTAQVSAAFNSGQIFGIYSGHGSTTSWADGPVFSQANVNALTNTIFPFVYSFACITGDYSASECFGETWLRSPTGASSFYGSSVNSYWDEDDILERGLIKALFDDNLSKVTPMFNKAKVYLVNHYGSVTGMMQRYLEMYNLMGDPSLETKRVIPPDTVAPLAVTNLALTDQATNALVACWTAPLDTTFGGITTYDLRFSTSPIETDAQFNSASQRVLGGQSDTLGCSKSFCIDSLAPNTNYYVRVKAKDMWGNTSPMSNQVNKMTWMAPELSVTPDTLNLVMRPDSTVVDSIILRNNRMEPSTLNYRVELANNIHPKIIRSASLSFIDEGTSKDSPKGYKNEEGKSGFSGKGHGGPDAFGYKWIDSQEPNGPAYVWNDIVSSGTQISSWVATGSVDARDDGYVGPLPIGFNFKFYGNTKTQLYVSTNGLITFDPVTAGYVSNATIPTAAVPNNYIAGVWDDLSGVTQGTVHYKAETDKFIVQYTNWQIYSASGSSLTFQIVIYRTGKILVYYKTLTGTLTACTVGIEDAAGAIGLLVAYNAAYLANERAIQYSADPEWMLPNHYSGMLLSQSSAALKLNITSQGLDEGNYSMDLVIKSNSFLNPVKTIPVRLTVTNVITPVELSSFRASVDGQNVNLDWTTATELNNRGFEVERKLLTEKAWQKAGFVTGSGNSTENKTYTYIDKNVKTGKYIYRLKQVDTDGSFKYTNQVEAEVMPPAVYNLSQNYPNPFNPSTTIRFDMPEKGHVSIIVYNQLGEAVEVLMNQEMEAGFHHVNWNASGMSSGVYFYQMKSDKYTMTKKLMLLK